MDSKKLVNDIINFENDIQDLFNSWTSEYKILELINIAFRLADKRECVGRVDATLDSHIIPVEVNMFSHRSWIIRLGEGIELWSIGNLHKPRRVFTKRGDEITHVVDPDFWYELFVIDVVYNIKLRVEAFEKDIPKIKELPCLKNIMEFNDGVSCTRSI